MVGLAIKYVSMGCDVEVVTLLEPKSFVEKLISCGVKVRSLNMRRGVPDLRAVYSLKKKIEEFKPDVVHAHMVHAIILARVVRMIGVNMPVMISSAHNTVDGGTFLKLLYKITDRFTDLTTNVSSEAAKAFVKQGLVPADKIKVMYNGVSFEKINDIDSDSYNEIRCKYKLSDRFTWLTVGRVDDDQKNIPLLLNAFASSIFNESKLLIVGSGILHDSYISLSEKLGLQDRVHFLGLRSDVGDIMNAVDGFVLASKWEGFPLVLLEAAVAKLPIVCTDVGGNREIVSDCSIGFVVESENERDLIGAMGKVQRMSIEDRHSMGKAAKKIVKDKYDLDAIALLWLELYEDILENNVG